MVLLATHQPVAELRDRVQARLKDSGYPTLSGVEVETHPEIVILSGRVPNFYLKQMAQSIAAQVCCGQRIQNEMMVVADSVCPLPA